MLIKKAHALHGEINIPGDKSISHRAIMFGSLSNGTTEITNFLEGADCLSTISCFQEMGIEIEREKSRVLVHGKGLHGLKAPQHILDAGNSGTTTRLISGILAGNPFVSQLDGDDSLRTRPMKRIMEPLRLMQADIESLKDNNCVPLKITGHELHAIDYTSKVASAQVKSCILLAGLYADGITSVTEPVLSRNHTELMLRSFGAKVTSEGTTASIAPDPVLNGLKVEVPGDISSAAYFIAAALLTPGSEVLIRNVGVNPTRDGILKVAKAMGGSIERLNPRTASGEPVCDLLVKGSSLHGTVVEGELIPTLIDEIPVIAVMAAFAEGITIIRDAAELKVKETDRILTVTDNLKLLGCDVTPTDDGMIIHGGKTLHTAAIDAGLDHRIAMSFAIAALNIDGGIELEHSEIAEVSYPDFYKDLEKLSM
ncbi:3-phosphoshikimate 1-carboxyvinyltransferase [Roseburia sp. AF15-21]|jgi:3-phosphoshikimate 1-carboxyvinyltransferase|uniref:3-phosphoshikimate 1-carboxyvinyltransferase n=1 Tax=Roseburia sp. AF15-21 TaxID=2293128 RepID=UPI000E5084E5|nr:3-phosphoshikimate 1-carboxyvinyltransferase [Roseburia sp. AF15-21]RHR90573.1 3-phosphoshikimate 1-carboxyvinyltransferase [Roseburia sp. AF15-21]